MDVSSNLDGQLGRAREHSLLRRVLGVDIERPPDPVAGDVLQDVVGVNAVAADRSIPAHSDRP
jgi:hypothetical protein